jgi:hypothetical protein
MCYTSSIVNHSFSFPACSPRASIKTPAQRCRKRMPRVLGPQWVATVAPASVTIISWKSACSETASFTISTICGEHWQWVMNILLFIFLRPSQRNLYTFCRLSFCRRLLLYTVLFLRGMLLGLQLRNSVLLCAGNLNGR